MIRMVERRQLTDGRVVDEGETLTLPPHEEAAMVESGVAVRVDDAPPGAKKPKGGR